MERTAVYAIARIEGRNPLTNRPTVDVIGFRVGQPTDWHTAGNRWERLDNRRRAGRAPAVRFDGRSYPVHAFEMRSVDAHGRGMGSERHEHALTVRYRDCKVTR